MHRILRSLFFIFVVKPVAFFLLGVNTHHRERLPKRGPAIIIANHNSHLDTLILISLFPLRMLHHVRPVAAADYFLSNPVISWFSKYIAGIVPITRHREPGEDPLEAVSRVLKQNGVVIFYPEGTRGEPNQLAKFKLGIAHMASKHPDVDIVPVFLHGTAKALPKGEALLVPFVVDVQVGEPIRFHGEKVEFVEHLEQLYQETLDVWQSDHAL